MDIALDLKPHEQNMDEVMTQKQGRNTENSQKPTAATDFF